MNKWTFAIGLAVAAGSINAQAIARKAVLINGGNRDGGKCTIEVVVDGSAEVEVRGDNATLRNRAGQTPQWRRFECTGALPANPGNFRFAGVDGRGRQTLARDPRNNNGAAVIQIEDSEGGAQGYTFDLFWGERGDPFTDDRYRQDQRQAGSDPRPFDGGSGQFDRDPQRFDRGGPRDDRRFTVSEAVKVCQDSVRDRAVARFRTPNIDFRRTAIDDNPGRQDWVLGELAVRRRFGRQEVYRFTCSVDFRSGQVRTAQIDQFVRSYYPQGR